MKLYGLNNIVKWGTNIYYINIVGEILHLLNVNCKTPHGVTIDDDEKDHIDDIELSDWVLDALFPRRSFHDNEEEWYWNLDDNYYTIEKGDELYFLNRGYNILMRVNTVRELQNAYHFYSDYEDEEFLTDDIDEKLKELFKLI